MRFRKRSIIDRTLLTMIIVVLIQSVIFTVTLLRSDIVDKTSQNAFDTLNEKVSNRRNYIENDMVQRWSQLESKAVSISNKITSYMAVNQVTVDDFKDINIAVPLINELSEDIINILRTNQVTGAFLVLGNDDHTHIKTNGLYLRDMDPIANPNDNSDLLCLRAPASISEALNIPLDIYWNPQFTFAEDQSNDEFYYRVLDVATSDLEVEYKDLGYWGVSATDKHGVSMIIYAMPLLDESGNVLGIIGIDISMDYLKNLMPSSELGSNASYMLAKVNANEMNELRSVTTTGSLYVSLFHNEPVLPIIEKTDYTNAYSFNAADNNQVYGNIQPLSLYNTNSPYADEDWVVVGFMQGQDLEYFISELYKACLLACMLSFAALFAIILVLSRYFTHPIRMLAKEVKSFNPTEPVKLKPTNILEIDELGKAIEDLSHKVADSASSFGRIISMSSYPFGAFEYYTDQERFFITDQLLDTIGISDMTKISNKNDLISILDKLERDYPYTFVNNRIRIYRITNDVDHKLRWVRMHITQEGNHIYGVVENVTREIQELRKTEYERDHDVLTSLLNRRAYTEAMNKLFKQKEELKVGALLMSDLDNLKYINDTFGHDCGDDYIRLMANVLKNSFPPLNSIISRISGDEFFVFLYGYDSKEEIQQILTDFEKKMNECVWKLPDGSFSKLRATTGVAWYPNDALELTELTKYADFTMYRMKHTQKGSLSYFDQDEYANDAYLLQAKEDLNKLIDEELVTYHFQPIVDVRTGEVFAYEALMRSLLPAFMNPLDILRIARSQSKLYFIEQLTFFKSMEVFVKQPKYENYKLFINTIANQSLNAEDIERFSAKYEGFLHNLVLEVTEAEKLEDRPATEKRRLVDKWHAKLAVDDYGTGYNGESVLLQTEPDFIKIDRSIIHNIGFDENRQILLQNIISYCKENKILVIAEGIENELEMKALIHAGVDYLQGFYLGQPSPKLQDVHEQKKQLIREYYKNK